ncbi:hypothetical protein S40293_11127 [Stachybotrys chartarum IBT 40293]|nr:hypothetical protein S40293_11127 [Stachybotrys chartarum IBT 40293]
MHFAILIVRFLVLAFAGLGSALPRVPSLPNMPPSSPANAAGTSNSETTLPGFNTMLRNQSDPVLASLSRPPFDGRCKAVTLGGHGKVGQTTLEGRCVDTSGHWWDTSLNLNSCIANGGGFMVYRDMGNFDESCRPCTLNDVSERSVLLLQCNCLSPAGTPRYTHLPLGERVMDALAVKPVNGRNIAAAVNAEAYFVWANEEEHWPDGAPS